MAACEEAADNSRFFDRAADWVDNALILAVKVNFPTLLRLKSPVTGSYALGAMIGHQEWIIDNIDKFFPPEEVADLIIEEFDRWLEAYMKTLTQAQRYQVIRHIRKSMVAGSRLLRAFDRACAAKTELFKQIRILP